ncbi:MAG: glycoside hydrolase family 88 protein [Clostridiales bacterium]
MIEKRFIIEKLNKLVESFEKTLYEKDEIFLKNMKKNNLSNDDINKYQYWEWTQGVGLYGLWILFKKTDENRYLDIIIKYYENQFKLGLPSKNINTTAPLLTLSYLYEHTKNNKYLKICKEWAEWLMKNLPRTEEGGFQHITSDSENKQELWDDTLFMAVLFLAKIGMILNNYSYIEEAKYQFLIHIKYLTDKESGLWFHGWTFREKHNFSKALWGRGNCWATMAIPILIEILSLEGSIKKYLVETLHSQVKSLKLYQDTKGMWHTLINDKTSYLEASATCGLAYGILKAISMGLLNSKYESCALKALKSVLDLIDEQGIVSQVSYGTSMGRENKDFYKKIPIKPMPYGQAIAILFLIEVINYYDKNSIK